MCGGPGDILLADAIVPSNVEALAAQQRVEPEAIFKFLGGRTGGEFASEQRQNPSESRGQRTET
jgi:hypothetical protein